VSATDPTDQPPPASEPAPPPVSLPAPPGVQTNDAAAAVDNTAPPKLPASPPSATAGLSTVAVPEGPVVSTVQKNETTAGQLHDLLANDSPYLEQARGLAAQAANAKGLLNSSIAVQSGEQAAISAAAPIANADAQTYANRATTNAAALNTAANTKQQGQIASQLSAQDAAQRLIELAKSGDIQAQLQTQKFGFDTQLSAQDNVQRLQQIAATGDQQARAQLAAFNYSTILADQQAGNDIKLEDKRFQDTLGTLAQQYQNSLGLNEQDTKLWIERQNVSHADTLDEISAQVTAQSKANSSINAQQTTAQLQSQYLTQVAQRQMLASQEVAAIYSTQGLTPAQQDSAVQTAMGRLQTDLNSLQAYYQNSPMFDPTWGQAPPAGSPVMTQPGHVNTPSMPTTTPAAYAPPQVTQPPAAGTVSYDQTGMPVINTPDLGAPPDLFSPYTNWGGWQG
jgi:hypothetical protein